jgi:citrate synthase
VEIWWRKEPLSASEESLLKALFKAHRQSSFRENISSLTVAHTMAGSRDIGKAIAAGILTLGGPHAPLADTYRFLNLPNPADHVESILKYGVKIPGWGGSFQKKGIDPLWSGVDSILREDHLHLAKIMDDVTAELHRLDKHIYPNPSAFTVTSCIALKVPAPLLTYIFISARLDAWAQIALAEFK